MFQRFHEMRERSERGFTLIELLVVILIIAILAAIAIPVFLAQREKGWVSQMESALKNASTAEESWATGNDGEYTATLTNLEDEGYRYADTVTPTATVSADALAYCVSVTHDQHPDTYAISNDITTPQEGTCAAGVLTPAP